MTEAQVLEEILVGHEISSFSREWVENSRTDESTILLNLSPDNATMHILNIMFLLLSYYITERFK